MALERVRVLDISGTGVQISTRTTRLNVDSQVVIAFAFGSRSYRLACDPVWVRRSRFGTGTRAGLRFLTMDERDRDGLVREIYRFQRSASRSRRR